MCGDQGNFESSRRSHYTWLDRQPVLFFQIVCLTNMRIEIRHFLNHIDQSPFGGFQEYLGNPPMWQTPCCSSQLQNSICKNMPRLEAASNELIQLSQDKQLALSPATILDQLLRFFYITNSSWSIDLILNLAQKNLVSGQLRIQHDNFSILPGTDEDPAFIIHR